MCLRLFRRSSHREHGQRRNRKCGRSSLCSDSDNVCYCEGKCAESRTSLRKGRPCRPADRFCYVATALVGDKHLKSQERYALVRASRIPQTFLRDVQDPYMSSLPWDAFLNSAHPRSYWSSRDPTKKKTTAQNAAYHLKFFLVLLYTHDCSPSQSFTEQGCLAVDLGWQKKRV